jgi:hypothetical protein
LSSQYREKGIENRVDCYRVLTGDIIRLVTTDLGRSEMDWFKKHLNITYAILWVLAVIIVVVAVSTTAYAPFLVTGLILSSVIIIAGSAWVLWKKGQSLWYLALVVVFSLALIIVVFVLPNKRSGQGAGNKIAESDYYKQREAGTK